MAVGGYGVGIAITYDRAAALASASSVGLAAVVLALLLGLPDPAAAGRLPRHRHHRRRPRSSGSSSGRAAAASRHRRRRRPQRFADDFYDLNPFDPRHLRHRRRAVQRRPAVGAARRLDARRCSSCLLVYLLMRSPWGRVSRSIREDEDAVRALGKNVYAYKMQSLVLGGVIGALGGMLLALGRQSVQPDSYRHRHHVLRLHAR